jgi:hypothetical protein
MKLSELVLLSDEEFDLVVNSILEGKTKNTLQGHGKRKADPGSKVRTILLEVLGSSSD